MGGGLSATPLYCLNFMKLILLFTILVLFNSCASLDVSKLSQKEILFTSYEDDSDELLKLFFERWQNDVQHQDINEINSDTLKIIYDIFSAIYNPVDKYFYLPNYPHIRNDPGIQNVPDFSDLYIVIQNKLFYLITDSLSSIRNITDYDNYSKNLIVIEDFRPKINVGSKIVYLSIKYENIIKDFLNKSDFFENEDKIKFIRRMANISGGITNSTYPLVQMIELNSSFNKAIVTLQFLFGGSEVLMKRVEYEWKIIDIKQTWIM
jgi:hypothetical protein